MKPSQNVGQTLLVTGQAPEAAHPPEVPLDHPAPWQQDKPARGLGPLDHRQGDPVVGRPVSGHVAGVALVDVGARDRRPGRVLDGRRQFSDLVAILLSGRRDVQREQGAQGIDGKVDRAALAPLGSVPPGARPPLSGVLCSVRLSRIIALGAGDRPSPIRMSSRQSAMRAVQTSASSQRRVWWETADQGGRSCGMERQCRPVRAMKRRPLNSSRREWRRCGASSRISVRYGARNAHSSSATSVG